MLASLPPLVVLVRHGHRIDDGDQPSPGLGLASLSELGHRQAAAFAASVRAAPELIVVSRFLRSIQTAAPLGAKFPEVPVETWPVEEFTFLPPQLFVGTTFRDREPQNSAYWRNGDPDAHPGPGGESFRDFIARVDGVLDHLAARPERSVLMVSHGYTMQALLWRLSEPGRSIDRTSFSEWNAFRSHWSFEPTGSVEILHGIVGELRPPPGPARGGEIRP